MKNMDKSESLIEKDPFVRLIEENLKSLSGLSKSKPNIYIVPERLRSSNEAAYSPKVVSIGPIHYGTNKPALLKMEAYKLFFFDQFLKRTSNRSLSYYANMMKEKEETLRSCYSNSETLKGLKSEEFLKIILVDATFIIECLLRSTSNGPHISETSSDLDYIFSSNSTWLFPDLQYDLLLLENQIPFFILVDLYHLIKDNLSPNNMQEVMSFKELLHSFFKPFVREYINDETKSEDINAMQHLLDNLSKGINEETKSEDTNFIQHLLDNISKSINEETKSEDTNVMQHLPDNPSKGINEETKSEDTNVIQHLLDFVWKSYIPTDTEDKNVGETKSKDTNVKSVRETKLEDTNVIQHLLDCVWKLFISATTENKIVGRNSQNIPSTTQLNDCGVSFREKKTKNLFDIIFDEKKGVLEIPKLTIDDYTDMMLRNLIAYEQCNCDTKKFSHYLYFIDKLVNTQEDVQLLVKKGIIENWLGDEKDVASMINKLTQGLIADEDKYFSQIGAQLDKYYRNSWHKWKANLKHNYFKNPWTIIAVVVTTFLLILAITQTAYSVYSTYKD